MNSTLEIIFGLFGGLAVFIFGMNMMSESLQKAAGEKMKSILAMLTRNPVMGVLAGALTTAVLQSSSATIAVLQNFASQAGQDGATSILGLTGAIPILLGDNIGTTITALLACIGQPKDAEIDVISRQIANAHTAFNITMTVIWIPLVWLMVKIVMRLVPDGKKVLTDPREAKYLDERLINQPAAAE